MEESSSSSYWKIGLIFFIALVVLLGLTFGTQQLTLISSQTDLTLYFPSVQNVREGDPVKILGVKKGKVRSIQLISPEDVPGSSRKEYRVRVTVALKGKQEELEKKLDEKYLIQVQSSSVLGGTVISVERAPEGHPMAAPINFDGPNFGTGQKGGMAAVGEWFSENRNKLSELVDSLNKTAASLQNVAGKVEEGEGTLGKMVTGEELYKKISGALEEFKKASANIREMTDQVNKGEGTMGKLMRDDKLYNQLSSFAKDASDIAEKINKGKGAAGKAVNDEQLAEDIKQLANQGRSIMEKINRGEGTFGKLVNEDDVYNDLNAITSNTRQITSKINDGEGTIGRLIHDEEMGKDLKTIISEMKEASKSIRDVSGKVNRGEGTLGKLVNNDELYTRAEESLSGIESLTGAVKKTHTFVGVENRQYLDSKYGISKAYLKIFPREDKFLKAGVALISLDHPDTTLPFKKSQNSSSDDTLTEAEMQIGGKFFDRKLTIRGGLIEGKMGGGIDYDLSPGFPLKFSVEGRQPFDSVEDDKLDEQVDGMLWRAGLETEFLQFGRLHAGVNRIGNDEEYYIGLGLEYEDQDIRNFISLLGLAN